MSPAGHRLMAVMLAEKARKVTSAPHPEPESWPDPVIGTWPSSSDVEHENFPFPGRDNLLELPALLFLHYAVEIDEWLAES